MTFIELCLAEQESPDAIDDYIDFWHAAPGGGPPVSLGDYLGTTADEYAYWARTADIEGVLRGRGRRVRRDVP